MRKQILLVLVIRAAFFALVIAGLNQIDALGTSELVLFGSALAATIVSTSLAFSRLLTRGFLLLIAFIVSVFYLTAWIGTLLPAHSAAEILMPYNLRLHGELTLFVFIICALSTWGFWRIRDIPTLELILLVAASVVALSGHRDFRLDNPQALSAIAWNLGIDQVYLFSIIGLLIVVTTLLYLALASLPVRIQLLNRWNHFSYRRGRRSFVALAVFSSAVGALLFFSFHFTYSYYHRLGAERLNNGVGEGSQEGLSPLGFHSALGSTNQPAALVRLDGDYRENPFTPMLYLREDALSEYNGHEMVIAGSKYDSDVAGNSPFEPYEGKTDERLEHRSSIVQSIYLLADHKMTMSIDYPISIRPLKNPNPGKFKASFRAYSMVPVFSKAALASASIGDPNWSDEERAHYLKTNTDPRYKDLAHSISADAPSPLDKAFALTHYLSKQSIYTLSPNHQVKPDVDQTAPYLFGDLRGYCVHFAHAMVYMLRSLGIPSRIGTGYLTDLSQSKDGHILLRMSDRHAWAEVYVTKLGWIPFDVQPEQVESHADTQVDLKMLEDLMGLLEPGEEILPKDLTKDEPSFESEWDWSRALPSRSLVIMITALLLLMLALAKLYLRYSWVVQKSPARRIRASYISLASRLTDLGYQRRSGETRKEYRQRLLSEFGRDALALSELISRIAYARPGAPLPSIGEVDALRQRDASSLNSLPWRQRAWALVNLSSLGGFLIKGRW